MIHALTLHEFNQLYRFLLHFDEKAVNQRTEVAIENHGRDGDDQAETSVVQRDGNAVGQCLRVVSRGRRRTEDFDHPDDRPKQAHQRGNRRNRAQGSEKSFQVMRYTATGLFDRFLHYFPRTSRIAHSGRQNNP